MPFNTDTHTAIHCNKKTIVFNTMYTVQRYSAIALPMLVTSATLVRCTLDFVMPVVFFKGKDLKKKKNNKNAKDYPKLQNRMKSPKNSLILAA